MCVLRHHSNNANFSTTETSTSTMPEDTLQMPQMPQASTMRPPATAIGHLLQYGPSPSPSVALSRPRHRHPAPYPNPPIFIRLTLMKLKVRSSRPYHRLQAMMRTQNTRKQTSQKYPPTASTSPHTHSHQPHQWLVVTFLRAVLSSGPRYDLLASI